MDWHAHAQTDFGIELTAAQVDQFNAYASILIEWNAQVNLTAITDPTEIAIRHFLDSLSLVRAFSPTAGMRLMDVGTGAGFPGLALAIAFPQLEVTLLEATGKKVSFLQHVIQSLGLNNAHTLNGRAEDVGHQTGQRGRYQVVAARAVARLPGLVEYMLPLATQKGLCIAMKGVTAEAEARDSRRALFVLGGKLRAIHSVQLPTVAEPHALVVIEKVHPTPNQYPRKPGIPTRKPLS